MFLFFLQPVLWAQTVFDDVTFYIDDCDDEEEYALTTATANALRAFLLGEPFRPFLEALDVDNDRVSRRKQYVEQVGLFQDQLRQGAIRELSSWLDPTQTKQYDEDDYADMNMNRLPATIRDWMALANVSSMSPAEQTVMFPFYATALAEVLKYTYQLHWKLDHVMAMITDGKLTGGQVTWEEYIKKLPFLAQCDDHVKNLTGLTPIMLNRNKAVITFSGVRACTSMLAQHTHC